MEMLLCLRKNVGILAKSFKKILIYVFYYMTQIRVFIDKELENNKEYPLKYILKYMTKEPTVELKTDSDTQILPVENATHYTLMVVDPDAPVNDKGNYYLHWMIINIRNEIEEGNYIVPWTPPAPPAGSGIHRYQFVLFTQPGVFEKKDILTDFTAYFNDQSGFMPKTRANFNMEKFASDRNLEHIPYSTFTFKTRRDASKNTRHKITYDK